MDAVYSGQSGVIALVEGAEARVRKAENLQSEFIIGREGTAYLFHGCNDVVVVRGAHEADVLPSFKAAWEADRALRLFLISLDPEEDTDVRAEACDWVEQLLANPHTQTFIENELYSRVLPQEVDIDFVFSSQRSTLLTNLVSKLLNDQKSIADRRREWDELPISLFEDGDKKTFEETAIRRGAFRHLASVDPNDENRNVAILNVYQVLKDQPNVRDIVNEWTADFKRPGTKAVIVPEDDDEEESKAAPRRFGHEGGIHAAFERSKAQRIAIAEKLRQGILNLARRYAAQLVEQQVAVDDAKFAAMSLCWLAQEAKYYHLHTLQLEWAQRAVQVFPDDPWAHGQAADALIQYWRLDEALKELDLCESLGDGQFAATGRARILRVQGHFDEALEAYRAVRVSHPGHEAEFHSWAGAAETLRDMWRFEEALAEYEEALTKCGDEVFLLCGRAAVLVDLGRLDDAIAAYSIPALENDLVALNGKASVLREQGKLQEAINVINACIEQYPSDPIARCSYAEILRAKGDLKGALEIYGQVKTNHPTIPVAYGGYAEVLRDQQQLGEAASAYKEGVDRFPRDYHLANGYANIVKVRDDLAEALRLYEENVRRFPYDLVSKAGRADLLKRLGKYDDAIAAYDEILAKWPHYENARNGKAAILVLRGRYQEALKLLPDSRPSTQSEWIAWHIRGMVLLRQNRLAEAAAFFEDGQKTTPFARERCYFDSALSAARLRQGEFEKAATAVGETRTVLPNILRFHAVAGMGNFERASFLYKELAKNCPTRLVDLRDAIAARFGLLEVAEAHNDNWIFEREAEALLQEAA